MKFEGTKKVFVNGVSSRTSKDGKVYHSIACFDGTECGNINISADCLSSVLPMSWHELLFQVNQSEKYGTYITIVSLAPCDYSGPVV